MSQIALTSTYSGLQPPINTLPSSPVPITATRTGIVDLAIAEVSGAQTGTADSPAGNQTAQKVATIDVVVASDGGVIVLFADLALVVESLSTMIRSSLSESRHVRRIWLNVSSLVLSTPSVYGAGDVCAPLFSASFTLHRPEFPILFRTIKCRK